MGDLSLKQLFSYQTMTRVLCGLAMYCRQQYAEQVDVLSILASSMVGQRK